jgi:hypothetical protein
LSATTSGASLGTLRPRRSFATLFAYLAGMLKDAAALAELIRDEVRDEE